MQHLRCCTRAIVLVGFAFAATAVSAQGPGRSDHWVTTWATATVPRPSQPPTSPPGGPALQPTTRFANQTLRQVVHISLGGDRLRIVLSNAFGTAPLEIGAAQVSLRQKDSSITPGTNRPVTFGGRPTGTIAAGAIIVSDPIPLVAPTFSDLAIDLHLPGDTGSSPSPLTTHANALQTNFVSETGNHAGSASFPVASTSTSWFFLARVEVIAPPTASGIAILGDSLTDGARSTPDTNSRWPDHLARALGSRNLPAGIANLGIAGNRLLADGNSPSGLARLDRDILAIPGLTHLVVMHGINDIGRGVPADAIVAAHRQIIARAAAKDLVVIGATLTPIEDTTFEGYFTPAHEAARQAVNQWIRTGKAYDAVIDFDAAVRDSARPTRLQEAFASPDYIHPNDTGYRAMARAIDLNIFTLTASLLSK